jgi:predicted nucleic acid-binding protein
MEILLDASAIIAVIADEPEAQTVINCTKNSTIVSPNIISCEIANALTRIMRKNIIKTKEQMLDLIKNFKRIPIKTVDIDLEKTLEIAWNYKIYAYDAFYLETAKRLNLPLLSFDGGMRKIGNEIGLTILGGQDAGI